MKQSTCVLEEIELIAEVTGMWNTDIGYLIQWIEENSETIDINYIKGETWVVNAIKDGEVYESIHEELYDALVNLTIKITGYEEKAPNPDEVAFNAMNDRDKWTAYWDCYKDRKDIEWRCKGCGYVDPDKPTRSQPFHGCSIHCDRCDYELTRRTGGGQGDPFGWMMKIKVKDERNKTA